MVTFVVQRLKYSNGHSAGIPFGMGIVNYRNGQGYGDGWYHHSNAEPFGFNSEFQFSETVRVDTLASYERYVTDADAMAE